MMKKILLVSLALFVSFPAITCTNIHIKAKDGAVVVGRTMEFGPDLQSRLMNSPREKNFVTATIDGRPTMQWTSRYGYLFADFFKTGLTVDGMNEKGLSFGYLYLPGLTTYHSQPGENLDQSLPYTFLGDWILGNFSTVREVEDALKNVTVYAQPASMGSFNNAILPVHAIITDKDGNSIVVEFINKNTVVSSNPLGILTNSPTFDWHITNLQNYINLSPYAPQTITLNGITYTGTGQGSGLAGLPGDPTPPSRFVKVAMLQQAAIPVDDGSSAVVLVNHILNNVDIPYGAIRAPKSVPMAPDNMDKTQWSVYKDLKNHIFYFRSYGNPMIQYLDMNKIDFKEGATIFALPLEQKPMFKDAQTDFMNAKMIH